MKPASIQEIKEELSGQPKAKLRELCLRLARYKKANKELLTYLLFEAHDEASFTDSAKKEMDESFVAITSSNAYIVKKSLRKILRTITRYTKYMGSKQAELEMLIHFCKNVNKFKIAYHRNTALKNIYERQLKKIHALLPSIHQDLQYDYRKEVDLLN